MELWEALDVDDSDLPSLLRPCKRRRDSSATHTSTAVAAPQSQSIHPTPSSSSSSPPHLTQPSQTLDSSFQPQSQSPPPSPVPSSLPLLIPGPAGAVQSAMLRKARDRQSFCSQDPLMPTQEYIRKAIEVAEEDEDFQRNPWLSAIEFVTADGTGDGLIPSAPLNSVKKCLNIGRADQVVAVIKSCTPNGLGDLMVTLKDPTGTVSGSIHRKVLSESEFAKDISVGSVLIVQKVAIFAPSRLAHYLNITVSNVLKVFHKDSGPPEQQKGSPARTVKYASPRTGHRAETRMSNKEFPLDHGITEDAAMNGIRTSGNARGNLNDSNHQDKRNQSQGSVGVCSNRGGVNIAQNSTVGEESMLGRLSRTKEIFNEAVRMQIDEDECRASANSDKLSSEGNLSGSFHHQNIVGNCSGEELPRTDPIQQRKEPLISSTSLPQWTDEQLNELFALNFEDDGFDV